MNKLEVLKKLAESAERFVNKKHPSKRASKLNGKPSLMRLLTHS